MVCKMKLSHSVETIIIYVGFFFVVVVVLFSILIILGIQFKGMRAAPRYVTILKCFLKSNKIGESKTVDPIVKMLLRVHLYEPFQSSTFKLLNYVNLNCVRKFVRFGDF